MKLLIILWLTLLFCFCVDVEQQKIDRKIIHEYSDMNTAKYRKEKRMPYGATGYKDFGNGFFQFDHNGNTYMVYEYGNRMAMTKIN